MSAVAEGYDPAEPGRCWCCGNAFAERELTRLGSHPEVGVCAGCAHWLYRRSRVRSDIGRRTPRARVRRRVHAVRARVVRTGAHHWPLLGPLLRRLDRHLP